MGRVFITTLVAHVLFDAEQRDIEVRNINNIVETYFVPTVSEEFHRSYTFNGTCGCAIAQCYVRMGTCMFLERVKEVAGINHMAVSTTIHNEFGTKRESGAVVEIAGNDGGLIGRVGKTGRGDSRSVKGRRWCKVAFVKMLDSVGWYRSGQEVMEGFATGWTGKCSSEIVGGVERGRGT